MRSKGISLGVLFYLLTFSTSTYGQVNIRSGEYRWSYTIPHSEMDIRITYSSRSTYSGLFGAGWCSGLDYEETEVGLFHCGRRIRKPPDDLSHRLQLRARFSGGQKTLITEIAQNSFKYKDNKLLHIRTHKKESWSFNYDEYQNLVSIKLNDSIYSLIDYDKEKDRVISVQKNSCHEHLSYKRSSRKRWISYKMICNGQLKQAQNYEMTYARSSSGKVYIKEVQLKTLKRSTSIRYSDSGEIMNINLSNSKEKI